MAGLVRLLLAGAGAAWAGAALLMWFVARVRSWIGSEIVWFCLLLAFNLESGK